jgi:hypothetical protein
MGEEDPIGVLDTAMLDAATRRRVLETNSLEFLGLPPSA